MIDDVIVHVATNGVVNPVDSTLTDLVVHVFVDVKLVNGYDTARGAGYQLIVKPGPVTITYVGGPTTIPTTPLQTTLPFPNNLPAYSFGDLENVGFATPLAFPPYTITGVAGNSPPVATAVSVRLVYLTLLSVAASPANVVDWMEPSDFLAIFPAPGMTFQIGGRGDLVPFASNVLSVITSPIFTNSPAAPDPITSFNPIAMGKQDPRVRTFSGRVAGDLANGVPPNLQFTNWVADSGTQVFTTAPDAVTYSSTISPALYNLLADLRSVEPPTGDPPSHAHLIDRIAEAPFQSVGELGYIHTGYPWRTLRLRSVDAASGATTSPYLDAHSTAGRGDPNQANPFIEATALPDWIVLDMFKVGPATTIGGRININQQFAGPATNLAFRLPPIEALIDNTSSNMSTYSDNNPSSPLNPAGTNVDALASNIVNRILVTNNVTGVNIASPYAALPVYLTPGEICEVQNLDYFSDPLGFSPVYDSHPSKTRREQLIRRVSNLITTRSSTFTIWCIAQSIKKVNPGASNPPGTFTPGTDLITGESKVQVIVQRYEDNSSGTPAVKFRTLYFRYLYN